MVEMKFLVYILFSFTITSIVRSRTFSVPATTSAKATLLVSESIQKTLNVLSLDPQPLQSLTSTSFSPSSSSSSSVLSLQLHTRSSLRKSSSHKDYKSLVLSRLARDSKRLDSLLTRLDSQFKLTDNKEELQVPVISGASHGSGEYFSRVGIGNPVSLVYMVIDTGSDINWLQCAPCSHCYDQTDPIYQPDSSSSYSPLTCDTHQCKSLQVSECENDKCLYEVSYGDGSYTVGDFVTETVTLTDSVEVNGVAIGCGHDNQGLFVGAAGLIGLGGGPLSFPSQINATSYSYCLVDRDSDSSSTLDFNSPIPNSNNTVIAPLLRNSQFDTFYYVNLTGISVGGTMLDIPESTFMLNTDGDGGVIIDSGTSITRLTTTAYNAFRDAFANATKRLPSANRVALFDTCYDFSNMESVDVPAVWFHFSNGEKLSLPAKNYLIPVDSSGTFCFAFAATSSSSSIIGNVQQQGIRVSYDIQRSVIGFSPKAC